jgi:hypothetical protein
MVPKENHDIKNYSKNKISKFSLCEKYKNFVHLENHI